MGWVNKAMKMSYQHASLAAGRWQTLPLAGQLANVGSDVARAHQWQEKDPQLCEKAFARALELLDLTIADPRWKGRRKELTRVRELLCDAGRERVWKRPGQPGSLFLPVCCCRTRRPLTSLSIL